jgi:hypothetical protein
MLEWLFRYKKTKEVPHYSALKSTPPRGLPPEVWENDESQSFNARRETLEQALLDPVQRPPIEAPLFMELLAKERGVVTLTLPNGGAQCVPVFSTPFRAVDYTRTLLNQGPRAHYLSSSPLQFVRMLRDLEEIGIECLTLDLCPRCPILATIGSRSIKVPDDAVSVWAIIKSMELARAELYFTHALESARAGFLDLARDVALEAVGHVTMEDPRLHLLLGQVAIGLGDRRLLSEAKAFLDFFNFEPWRRKLGQVEGSGALDFADPRSATEYPLFIDGHNL